MTDQGGPSDPFTAHDQVPVAGGELHVARAGPPPEEAAVVVLAVHGITASHLAWRAVARELAARGDVSILAPDLRGRGHSSALPPPYGMAAHAADMVAVLDRAGGDRPVVAAGHSMGAYVVARMAADHPERAGAVVLLDGGLTIPNPPDMDADEVLAAVLGPALARLSMTFASREEYLAFWHRHPAYAHSWNEDVEAYVVADLAAGEPGALRSVISEAAVRTDGAELLRDEEARTAVERIRVPLTILRAPRGLLDDENALIPRPILDAFAEAHPDARIEEVPDVNHYTLLMGARGGAARAAAAIDAAARAQI